MANVQYNPQQYQQQVQQVLDQQGLSNLPPNTTVYYQVNGAPPQQYSQNQQYYVQQDNEQFVPQGFVRTTQGSQQGPKVPPHQNIQTDQVTYQQQGQPQQMQQTQQYQQNIKQQLPQQAIQQQYQQGGQQQFQQGGQQQQYSQKVQQQNQPQQVQQTQQFQQQCPHQQVGQHQYQQQQVGQQQYQQGQQHGQQQRSQQGSQQQYQQSQQQLDQNQQGIQDSQDISRFQGYQDNAYEDAYRYQHAIQRAERANSEKPSFFVDAEGNYHPTSEAPTYTTKEVEGAPVVNYSSFPRRAKSVEPSGNAAEVGYLYGGSDFIDHSQDFFDPNGERVDLSIHGPDRFIRREGDNYGLDFNSTVHRGENVDVEEYYTGYHAQKPRKHWTYCPDPFNPDNTYVEGLFGFYDPNDLVGDTIANHRLLVERQLTDEEREQFCTPFAQAPGHLPQHRTEKPEPKEPGPICYSLSAKKELAREDDRPNRSQSVGPVNAGYGSGVANKKDVNLLSLLDDSTIQRQQNVIQPAPWAPESDYKQGRWQTSGQQLEPLNRRPQGAQNQPEWSQQIQNKKNVFAQGPQTTTQVEQPPYWQNQTAQPRGAVQDAYQRQGAPQQQQQQQLQQQQQGSQNISTNYTYFQKGQQQQPQISQQQRDIHTAYTVQKPQQQQPPQVLQKPGQQQIQRQPQQQQPQQQNRVAQQPIQRRPQSQPPPQVQQRQQNAPQQQFQQTTTTRTFVNGQPVQAAPQQQQQQQQKHVGFSQGQQQNYAVANGTVPQQQVRQGQQTQAQNVFNKQPQQVQQQQFRQAPQKTVQVNGNLPTSPTKTGQQQFTQAQPQQYSSFGQQRGQVAPPPQSLAKFVTSQGQNFAQGRQQQGAPGSNQQNVYGQAQLQR